MNAYAFSDVGEVVDFTSTVDAGLTAEADNDKVDDVDVDVAALDVFVIDLLLRSSSILVSIIDESSMLDELYVLLLE